jgi:hypothetical protein
MHLIKTLKEHYKVEEYWEENGTWESSWTGTIRSTKQNDIHGASNIVLPCPGSKVIFHLLEDLNIILKLLICSPSNVYQYNLVTQNDLDLSKNHLVITQC